MSVIAVAALASLVVVAPAPASGPAGKAGIPSHSPAPPTASKRADGWIDGPFESSSTVNCITGQVEYLGDAWVGYYGEIGVSPAVNNVYYTHVVWGIVGNPCTGGAYVHDEIFLPATTKLAISSQNPVICYFQRPGGSEQPFTDGCPQSPGAGMYGGYSFDAAPNGDPWPSADGTLFEFQIPVKSSGPLNGLVTSDPCQACLQAGVWMIDGVDSPWVFPKQGVYVVGSGGQVAPSITYPAPAVTAISFDQPTNKVHATTWANLFSQGTTGTAYLEIGNSNGNYQTQGGNINIPSAGNWSLYQPWQMTPGHVYHYRACYVPSGGSKVCGHDQAFTAPPDTAIGNIAVKRAQHRATVAFTAPLYGASYQVTFQCNLDGGGWKPCDTPKVYKHLSKGKHAIAVRSVDPGGNRDATPARATFRV